MYSNFRDNGLGQSCVALTSLT